MPEDQIELELVEVYQDLRYEGEWVYKVGVRLAGRVREGLGWGKTPEEAKKKAVQEALSLAPEARGLLEAIEKALTPPQETPPQGERKEKEVSPEAPPSSTSSSPPEGASAKSEGKSGSPFSVGEAMGKVVKALKQRFPEAFYLALEEIGMGEKELQTLVSLIEQGKEGEVALEKARKVYGTFREIYKSLASREEKLPRKELVVLVRKVVESRFGEKS
jgi:hypothetical protein